jgi:hypothetical protein
LSQPQPEVVYLETSDRPEAVREQLRNAEGKQVLLVVPKECPGLDSLVDLKLLGRQAIALDKEIALVTRDRGLKELAKRLGFRTFSSVERGQRANWKGSKPHAQHFFAVSPRYRPSSGRVATPVGSETLRLGETILFSFVFVGMLALLGLVLIVFVPTATVTLEPVTYPVSTTVTIQANPDLEDLDFVNLRMPARVMEIEVVGSDQIATTAMRDEPDAKATGEVVFTNRRSQATTVISGTVVTTSAGTTIRFLTTEEATLPPRVGGRARAPVEAVEPGPSGNVPAYSINRVEGLMDRQVNVINVAPTKGGEMSQVTYVTNADKEQLRESLVQRLKQEGYDSMVAELSEEEFLPPESLVAFVLSETYDRFPGDAADSLGLHMRILIRGTVIDREDAELLGLRMLQLEVREGFQLLSEETEFQVEEVSEADYDGTLTFEMNAEGATWMEIDEVDIREGIMGKDLAQAEEDLARQLSLAREPLVEVSPEWWGWVPWLPFRISVHVESAGTRID